MWQCARKKGKDRAQGAIPMSVEGGGGVFLFNKVLVEAQLTDCRVQSLHVNHIPKLRLNTD